jgi:hypothetical protein
MLKGPGEMDAVHDLTPSMYVVDQPGLGFDVMLSKVLVPGDAAPSLGVCDWTACV